MTSTDQVITRWVAETRKESPRYLRPSNVRILIGNYRGGAAQYAPIYSYGSHFELGRWVPATADHRGYWLLNGDTYSVSTTRHQSSLRSAVKATGEPVLILPFTPLASAGIDRNSIVPIEITDDRQVPAPVTGPLSILPDRMVSDGKVIDYYLTPNEWREDDRPEVTDHGDGTYTWHRTRHVLGESVFTARYRASVYTDASPHVATFLSGFDAQESRPHYFLAQLPAGAEPIGVKDAFESLRPAPVTDADALGVQVTRQGDVFAVPAMLTTRELHSLAPSKRAERLLGLSHVATEVIVTPKGNTYARGILTHRPEGMGWTRGTWGPRQPEHRRQRMGDGRTWHLIVKNTVPLDERGESRAWSRPGNVD